MRQRYVIGNWKMNGRSDANSRFCDELSTLMHTDSLTPVILAVCPPACYISQLKSMINGVCRLGAQDVSTQANGAFTGQCSAAQLVDNGVTYCLVGHSERRQYCHENNDDVRAKCEQLLHCGITPVVCIGETLSEYQQGVTETVIAAQLNALAGCDMRAMIIAYEPIWAIGTGQTATPEQAQHMHATIRAHLVSFGQGSECTAILYGGSVKPDNAAALIAQPDIDGFLVGGASLEAQSFYTIAQHSN